MTAVTGAIVAAIVGLVVGSLVVPGMPVFAIPIVLVLVVLLGGLEFRRRGAEARSMEDLRDEAKADSIEFSARDKRTLAS